MIPGEVIPAAGEITLNEGAETLTLTVANSGDRPVQVVIVGRDQQRPARPVLKVPEALRRLRRPSSFTS